MEAKDIIKKEIERKFLVKKPLSQNDLSNYPSKQYYQCYLNQHSDFLEVRARCVDEKDNQTFFLNMKDMGNKSRNEITIKITQEEFDVMWQVSSPKHISKKRYFIPTKDGKFTIEYDVYDDNLKGLIICEVECDDEKLLDSYIPEEWMDREVTNEDGYKNRSLAAKGIPTPPKPLPYDAIRDIFFQKNITINK